MKVHKTIYQHIYFERTKGYITPYTMHSNNSFLTMGTICWYKSWKKYIVTFNSDYVFDENCLRDIADFLDQLNNNG